MMSNEQEPYHNDIPATANNSSGYSSASPESAPTSVEENRSVEWDQQQAEPSGHASSRHYARSRFCAICGVDTKNYNLNYGGSSCLSCRAFFRRIIQQKTKRALKCKGNDSIAPCRIEADTRKACKKCRFQACLKAGMRPEAVLNEEQFKQRFRKLLRKKETPNDDGMSSSRNTPRTLSVDSFDSSEYYQAHPEVKVESPSTGSEAVMTPETQLIESPNDAMVDLNVNLQQSALSQEENDRITSLYDSCVQSPDDVKINRVEGFDSEDPSQGDMLIVDDEFIKNSMDADEKKFITILNEVKQGIEKADKKNYAEATKYFNFVTRVRRCWQDVCKELRVQSDFAQSLLSLHKGDVGTFTKAVFRNHLETLGRFFSTFAYKQPEFLALSKNDQRQLLLRNTKLFVQYFLGRYFYAGSGYKQQQWLLLCQVLDYLSESSYVRFIPLMTFNRMLHLFKDPKALEIYEGYAKKLNNLSLGINCNCAMGLICLYSHDENTPLENREMVKGSLEFIYDCTGWAKGKFNCGDPSELKSVVDILVAMANSFDEAVDWTIDYKEDMEIQKKTQGFADADLETTVNWTTEKCFNSILKKTSETVESLPFGGDIVQEHVMYCLEVPISKHFVANTMKVFEDRFLLTIRLFVSQDEFVEQVAQNCKMALTLVALRHVCCKDYTEQAAMTYSRHDVELTDEKFAVLPEDKTKKKITFFDIAHFMGVPESDLEPFMKCLDELGDFVKNQQAYDLTNAIILFMDIKTHSMPESFGFAERCRYFNDKMNEIYPQRIRDFYGELCRKLPIVQEVSRVLQDLKIKTQNQQKPLNAKV